MPGGLVPIVTALLEQIGGHWIYAAPGQSDSERITGLSSSGQTVTWQTLPIRQELMDSQHELISIRTLLWTFHYLHDTATAPIFDGNVASGWRSYDKVNRDFAAALAAAHYNSHGDVVLVHDFHLMLVPGYLAHIRPERESRLGYFHHVPWCEPDYFGILPEWMASQILQSLLCCDFVGFHCDRWGDAFLACCDRFIPDVHVEDRVAFYRGHETVVVTSPGPIDAAELDRLSEQSSTERWRDALRSHANGRRILARVDRLDLWKNLIRGFLAYEAVLQRRPQLAQEMWFCAVVTPARLQTDRHRQYQAICHEVVQKINDRHAGAHPAVSLLYPEVQGSDRTRAVAALSLATVTLVNPTYDGLNLVAKEAAVLNPDAHLLLSTNAGAYPSMASIVVPIQPFDVLSTADALDDAINDEPGRVNKASTGETALRAETPADWLHGILLGPGSGVRGHGG
jgi:trehalose 6-phosphate synthase